MRYLHQARYAFLALALTLLSACAYLNIPKAENVSEGLVYAHSTVNGIVASTTNALRVGAIHSSDAEYARKVATESRTVLEAAEVALTAGDIQTAEGRLSLVRGILGQLQSYLASKGVKS